MIEELLNQASQFYGQSRLSDAEQICRRILSLDPVRAEAVYLLAAIDQGLGRGPAAVEGFARAAALAPDNPVFVNAWGESLQGLGRLDEAWNCYQQAIRLRPDYARAHNNSGRILNQRGDLAAAERYFLEAIRLNPNYATAHNNLGGVLLTRDQTAAAIQHLQQALSLQPDYPEAHYNLAAALRPSGDLPGMLLHLDHAIRLRPSYARAHLLLGKVLFEAGQVESSASRFETAVRLQPDDPESHFELGTVQFLLNRLLEAEQSFRTVLSLNPEHTHAYAQLCRLKATVLDWEHQARDHEQLLASVNAALKANQPVPIAPLHALAFPWPGPLLLEIARSQASSYQRANRTSMTPTAIPRIPRPSTARLKIAYLSRDLYDHPVSHQIQGLFALHDRERFDVHAYSFGPNDGSVYRRRIEQTVESFHDVSTLTDDQLARQIRADGTDILVDLMGYTGLARTACVAMRPAPIQVSWLGFPATMGAEFIDYLIADPIVAPPEHSEFYQERLVRLPHSYMPTDHTQPISRSTLDRSSQGLPTDVPVFCCFNNSYKITPEVFQVWMAILSRVSDAVAWLNITHPIARNNLRRESQKYGINPDRLIFAERVPDKANHLARLQLADLFLDTPFYNAHTTACDALWAGLPTLTCIGQTFQSRVGASLLTAARIPELIARDLNEYEQIAVQMATDPNRLTSLRTRLQDDRERLPLFDTPRFVRHLEQAFLTMWQIHESGKPASEFDVRESC